MWKTISEFPKYEVSDAGIIRMKKDVPCKKGRKKASMELTPSLKRNGYMQVCLYRDGERKYVLVHRIVAKAFLPNPDNLPQVNHKDENKQNNAANNLEWCEASYNAKYGTGPQRRIKSHNENGSHRAEQPVYQIKDGEIEATYRSIAEAARYVGVNEANIRACLYGRTKSCGGYGWRRIDQ